MILFQAKEFRLKLEPLIKDAEKVLKDIKRSAKVELSVVTGHC